MAKESVMLLNETKYLQNPKVTKPEENFALIIFYYGKYLTLANKIKLIVSSTVILHDFINI